MTSINNVPKRHESTRKFTREDWIASARTLLVSAGIDDVKIDRIARKMKVTRGSFYWHFNNHKDLLDSLLSDWEGRNYFEIAQVRARWARTEVNLSEVVYIWLNEDPNFPAFDMAVRVWARKDTHVEHSVARVDEAWISLLREVFVRCSFGETESLIRARIAYFHQIGYYAIDLKEDIVDRIRLAPYYYEILTGRSAPVDLVERLKVMNLSEHRSRKHRRRPFHTTSRQQSALVTKS